MVLGIVTLIPFIPNDPAYRGRGAAKECGMANGRDRGKLQVVRVCVDGALLQQLGDAAMVVSAKAREVIVAELIDHYGQEQLRLLFVGGDSRGKQGQEQSNRKQHTAQFDHGILWKTPGNIIAFMLELNLLR